MKKWKSLHEVDYKYSMVKKRAIAFYLPQYHPFNENDEWWGKGFTEWRNVVKAKPLYRGHYQPHLPADLGFYDLRIPEVREQQAEMAKKYGVSGFCYYHYWFNGHQLMERPLKEVLASGKPDFPFMICWANENWTRAWDGGEKQILISQNHSEEDDRIHIRYLLDEVFCAPQYIKVDGKPVFLIYRSTLFPNMKETIRIWREEAALKGLGLYLCRVETTEQYGKKYLQDGFDAAVEFQPSTHQMREFIKNRNPLKKIFYNINRHLFNTCEKRKVDYSGYVDYSSKSPIPDYKMFPGVTPMWDNTARRKERMFILDKSTPEKYGEWLKSVVDKFVPFSEEENFIFINAWNEWAEGNHLEPDQKWGFRYLEETRKALDDSGE